MTANDPWGIKLSSQALADLREWSQLPYPEFQAKYTQGFGLNINDPLHAGATKNSPLFPSSSTIALRNQYNAPYLDLNLNLLGRLRGMSRITGGSLKTPGFGPDQNTPEDYYNFLRNMTPAQQAEFDRVNALIESRSDDKSALGMAFSPGGAVSVATAFLGALGMAGAGPMAGMFGKTGGLLNKGAGMIGSTPASGGVLASLTSMSPARLALLGLSGAGMLMGKGSYPSLPTMPALKSIGRTNMASALVSNPEKLKRGRQATILNSGNQNNGLGIINRPSASATLLGG